MRREAEAIERRARVEAEEAVPKTKEQQLTPTLPAIAEWDINRAIRAGREPEYVKSLRQRWWHLAQFFPDPGKVTGETLEAYVDFRLRQKVRRQTIRTELGHLKRGLTLAWGREYAVELPRRWPVLESDDADEKQASKWHPIEVLRAFFVLCQGEARTMMLLALLTGCREGEMMGLGRDPGTGLFPAEAGDPVTHFLVVNGKRRGRRVLPVHPVLLPLLQADLPFKTTDHFSHWRTCSTRAYGRATTRQTVTRRDMRAAFATLAGPLGDQHGVGLMMGHSGGIAGRYQKAYLARLAPLTFAVYDAVFGTQAGKLLITDNR